MPIKKLKGSNKRSGRCVLAVGNDCNIYEALALKEALAEYLDSYKNFELDLSKVEEFDCAGFQLLFSFWQAVAQEEKTAKVTSWSPVVETAFNTLNAWEAFGVEREVAA